MARLNQREIFEKLILGPVCENYPKRSEPLCSFMALEGDRYKNGRKLMVVGRAVNSWGDGKSTAELQDLDARKNVMDGVFYPDGECQMAWVVRDAGASDQYNTNRSAFWRVIRQVSRGLGVWQDGQEDEWSSHLVWSNLYKISPHAGGNPSNKLCEIQEPGCIDLLREEIREYAPERIVFLTGMGWAWPFMKGLGAELQAADGLVEAIGTISVPGADKETSFVVARHPQGKAESEWVEAVLSGFESLEARLSG